VVLHTFDIVINYSVVNTEQPEKFGEQFVSPGDSAGQFFTGGSQNEPAVLFIFEKPLSIEPLNHVRDARLRNL